MVCQIGRRGWRASNRGEKHADLGGHKLQFRAEVTSRGKKEKSRSTLPTRRTEGGASNSLETGRISKTKLWRSEKVGTFVEDGGQLQ